LDIGCPKDIRCPQKGGAKVKSLLQRRIPAYRQAGGRQGRQAPPEENLQLKS